MTMGPDSTAACASASNKSSNITSKENEKQPAATVPSNTSEPKPSTSAMDISSSNDDNGKENNQQTSGRKESTAAQTSASTAASAAMGESKKSQSSFPTQDDGGSSRNKNTQEKSDTSIKSQQLVLQSSVSESKTSIDGNNNEPKIQEDKTLSNGKSAMNSIDGADDDASGEEKKTATTPTRVSISSSSPIIPGLEEKKMAPEVPVTATGSGNRTDTSSGSRKRPLDSNGGDTSISTQSESNPQVDENGTNDGDITSSERPLKVPRCNELPNANAIEGGKSVDEKSENKPVTSLSKKTGGADIKPSSAMTASTGGTASNDTSNGLKMGENQMPPCDDAFKAMVNLDPIPSMPKLEPLSPRELAQLEHSLQIGEKFSDHAEDTTWREDWNGNLQLIDKDIIMNRDGLANNPCGKRITIQFCDWVAKVARHADDFEGIRLLFSFVYNMKDTPLMAKQILAYHLQRPATSVAERLEFVLSATRRISYDPAVLCQDGWTTLKSDVPDGHTGGSHLIGRRVIWHSYEAIVIAFVRDEDIGDLWKCMWVEDHDTFDLEADELQDGMKKWEKKVAKRKVPLEKTKPSRPSSVRFEASRNFTVDGVEDGIVLAKSYKCKGGRPWPARIMHVTEVKELGTQVSSRRSSSKSEVHLVFLAPYWNAPRNGSNSGSSEAQRAKSQYSTGPLFELETMDVSSETILKYPYTADDGEISIQKIKDEFSFLGLPKAAFSRFLDAHRIALSLKAYARRQNKKTALADSITASFSSLTDTHPLSIKTFSFPDAMLNLPFGYILSKYPNPMEQRTKIQSLDNTSELKEPIMQLHLMLQSIIPPMCWGGKSSAEGNGLGTPKKAIIRSTPDSCGMTPTISPSLNVSARAPASEKELWTINNFASEYLLKHFVTPSNGSLAPLGVLNNYLRDIVQHLNRIVIEVEQASIANLDLRQKKLSFFIGQCMATKGNGEEYLFAALLPKDVNGQNILREWRKACERVIRRAVVRMGHMGTGNGVTAVLTDSRCNEHITANGSFERAVRLPAALKGAKMAGAGSRPSMPLITKVEDEYLSIVENKILPMAHKSSYLKRIKDKVSNLPQDAKGVPLTDDSDGEGGEDTMGSRGSFTAAVTGVAAALKGVDMIIEGKCVNAFCAVRPPGHHAGRELRPMNAMSNGFCLLNAAASAALYAATPRSQGGLGLNRVCVIDIDVHHGNGTQDILCSTHDPRFFYVSTHAGGPHINGYEDDSSDDGLRRSLNMNKNEGIFPGRCGDTNPHPGVLNVPLGRKVTPSDLGTKLVSEVTPAVEKFDPELIIISAGFDAHMNDPLGMGGLTAFHFGTVTQIICQMALKSCSGRVLSILEGGYGVPCCRPLAANTFLPNKNNNDQAASLKLLSLGNDLPDSMDDQVDFLLAKKLDKCHQEGFLECVREHVKCLGKNSGLV